MFSLLHCYYPLLPFKIINYYYICYQLDNLQMWDQNFTLNTFAYCFLAPFCHLGLKKSLNQEYFGLKGPNWHSWLPFVSDCDENGTFSDQNCPVYTFTSASPPHKDTQTALQSLQSRPYQRGAVVIYLSLPAGWIKICRLKIKTFARCISCYHGMKIKGSKSCTEDTNIATLTPKSNIAGVGDPEGCLEVFLKGLHAFRAYRPLNHSNISSRG